jgi:hydroxymethylglutaryl-CoA lyase
MKFANIIEVALRDGLQTEKRLISSHSKLHAINRLVRAGVKDIEITSFVNTKLLPQFDDNYHIARNVLRYNNVKYSALVPNEKGYHKFRESGNIDEAVLFISTSETFNKKNINSNIKDAFERFVKISKLAKDDGVKLRGSISCCFTCPYEGDISTDKVRDIIKRYIDIGVDRIDIADTIGTGTAIKLKKIVDGFDVTNITGHYHDTNGKAIELVEASLDNGIYTFHSSIKGTGGCPFSSKIVGNLSTEKLVEYLHSKGIKTGIELEKLKDIRLF